MSFEKSELREVAHPYCYRCRRCSSSALRTVDARRQNVKQGGVALNAEPALPTVVVLDNAGSHRAGEVREALPQLRERRVYLYYLPPYRPMRNAIERLFRVLKHHELPERSYATFEALHDAVHQAFSRYEDAHCTKPTEEPRRAAS